MNIHPLIVHFPIAFLCIYALLELVPSKKVRAQQWFNPLRLGLLYIGTFFSFIALQTGEFAEGLVGETLLVERHAFFASLSVWLFATIAITTIILGIQKDYQLLSILKKIATFLKPLIPFLALLGLLSLVITGALGGSISHGSDADFITKIIYSLFGN